MVKKNAVNGKKSNVNSMLSNALGFTTLLLNLYLSLESPDSGTYLHIGPQVSYCCTIPPDDPSLVALSLNSGIPFDYSLRQSVAASDPNTR